MAAMISGVSRTYEELEVGAVYRSRHGRTVLEADNVWFTLLTLNTNPIHFDAEYAATVLAAWASRYLGWLFGVRPVQHWLNQQIQNGPPGPSERQRIHGQSVLWGEVTDAAGARPELGTKGILEGSSGATSVGSSDTGTDFQSTSATTNITINPGSPNTAFPVVQPSLVHGLTFIRAG